jgi:hypothetical protein
VLPFTDEGAVSVMLVLSEYLLVNWVVPLPFPSLSFGLTVTATPLLGLEEATVK